MNCLPPLPCLGHHCIRAAISSNFVASAAPLDRKTGSVARELADRLGWKPEQIAELEIGRRIVRAADLILIARALGIDPEKLFHRVTRW